MPDNLDPLRHIEGFPLGDDADLHALSDPPHYTAYPNPHLADFIAQHGAPYDEATDDYHREPYVADVSEGKNDPIYNAHSYHTKVPYKAIIPFIEHYTQPGDIVFDGFCGTGMTGVAANESDRRAILSDLSSMAAFIAFNYNTPIEMAPFKREAKRILKEIEKECSWMYETRHSDGRIGYINYVVWSDVFLCPYCNNEIVFWDSAVDQYEGKVVEPFPCPTCDALVSKRQMARATRKIRDKGLHESPERAHRVPVLINYNVGSIRYEKQPDEFDFDLLSRIDESEIPFWYPTDRMPEGGESRRNDAAGVTHIHHFYTNRNLWVLAAYWAKAKNGEKFRQKLMWTQTGSLQRATLMHQLAITRIAKNRPAKGGKTAGHRRGTLYIPSLQVEFSPLTLIESRIDEMSKAFAQAQDWQKQNVLITNQSSTDLSNLPDNTIDYIFTDPPFGENIMYSELNFIWEAWLRVVTNNYSEAIINNTQLKGLDEYRVLMTSCFVEMYRILKPGRWITVVFHNSKASVWNAIQEALAKAGFLVAQVTVLDKVKKTHTQVTAAGAVKNDLVINAYKPRAGFSQKFTSQAGRGLEADFVRQHLQQLPLAVNVERSKEMLYSKYLAYYVQHGYQVQYNGEQFYRALAQWGLVEADGYWFSDEIQLQAYFSRKAKQDIETAPQAPLFVFDERSAIQWLKHTLHGTPATLSDLQPAYLKALQTSQDQMPDLRDLLDENFGQPDSAGRYHWPNPQLQQTLEEARQQRLLRHFNDYLQQATAGQRLKEVRKEALVAGFTEAYRSGRFADILTIGRRLDKSLLEENLDLFDFVEIAEAKLEG